MSKRSPLFYVGDKYKLIDELKTFFPDNINIFVEPFVGGGSAFMNVEAQHYILNDIDQNVIQLHRLLCTNAQHGEAFIRNLIGYANHYGLSCSYLEDIIPANLKEQYPKTYFAEYNRVGYNHMREDYNKAARRNPRILYLLLIYGFNRMLRFNRHNDFNIPVGNVDFNTNVVEALNDYFDIVVGRDIQWSSIDFRAFFQNLHLGQGDLVYLDPPYLITFSEYNKLWNDQTEADLLQILDGLNANNIRFAISNVTHYKGRVNQLFLDWASRYNIYPVHSNYISYHDNTIKRFNEVLVTNY
ncbi:MAG: Dam family site-specific DNA-(adenine-N6)-methyltransferase [bacterium]|nr:Dam family site-specific DNA-(adenine-N6)-methyltransferase [bacterium]